MCSLRLFILTGTLACALCACARPGNQGNPAPASGNAPGAGAPYYSTTPQTPPAFPEVAPTINCRETTWGTSCF